MAVKVLITGASGLIGSRLSEMLSAKGFQVSHLGRSRRNSKFMTWVWNINEGWIDPQAFDKVDVIVNLAGAGIAEKRWTGRRKREILESRIKPLTLLRDHLMKSNHRVKAIVSASAIGYYGSIETDQYCTEETSPGKDFLADVVRQWEQAADSLTSLGLRVVKLRIGIVLSNKGGAVKSMATPIRWGIGAALGSGRQTMSWIHLDDLCALFVKAIEDDTMKGIYNAVGPNPATNAEITHAIATALRRPLLLPPVPGFVLRAMLGEMAGMVLGGCKVSSERIRQSGFQFQYPELKAALTSLFSDPPSKGPDTI